jgi:hypothetical protein
MLKSILKLWIPLATVMLLLSLMVYVAVQQTYRTNANDPQIQMAEEAEHALNNGAEAKALVRPSNTEIATSLLPFTLIYGESGKLLAGDALLDGAPPVIPSGVFKFAQEHREDVLSWQPRPGVRSALVVHYCDAKFKGFVVTGRSLRLTEEREGKLVKQVGFILVFSLGVLLILAFLMRLVFK